jgi:hypothetical protein
LSTLPRPKTIRDMSAWKKFRKTGSKQLVFARRLSDGRWKVKFTRIGLIRRTVDADAFEKTYEAV